MSDQESPNKDSAEKFKGTYIKEEPYDPDYDSSHHCTGQPLKTTVEMCPVPKVVSSNAKNTVTGTEIKTEHSSTMFEAQLQPNINSLLVVPIVKQEPVQSEPVNMENCDGTLMKEEPHGTEYDAERIDAAGEHQHSSTPSMKKEVCEGFLPKANTAATAIETKCEQSVSLSVGGTAEKARSMQNSLQARVVSVDDCKDKTHALTHCTVYRLTFNRSESNVLPKLPTIKTEPPDPPCQDGGHDSAPHLDGADPVKMWTVTSSHVVPFSEAGSHPIQTTSCHENLNIGGFASTAVSSLPEKVKRSHEDATVHITKRQKQEVVTTTESSVNKQDCGNIGSEMNSAKKEDLTCDFCSSHFSSQIVLESHQCKSAIYYCKICCMESTRRRRHVLMPLPVAQHHLRLHLCLDAGGEGSVNLRHSLVKNALRHVNHFPEELKRIQKASLLTSEQDIVLLQDLYLGIGPPEASPYVCGLCKKAFTEASYRSEHIATDHVGHIVPKCDGAECEKMSFLTRDKLLRHMFEIHCDFEVDKRLAFFKCMFCSQQFQDRTDLEWHFYRHMKVYMKPTENAGASSQADSDLQPLSCSKGQFRCTICSYDTISHCRVPLYTASEAHDHLAWHWLNQPPPEIRKSPPALSFERDSVAIHHLYMAPFTSDPSCQICGRNIGVHVLKVPHHFKCYHKELISKPNCCSAPECKHLQFIMKKDFFGHMFMQHVRVVKKDTFMLMCQICGETFNNRSQVEWHCYFHKIKGKQVKTKK